MKKSLEQSKSIWMDTGQVPKETSLTEKKRGDVCVVGAGIAGLTTAYLLAREGRSVVVLDDGPIGGGETGRTSAHLSSALDDRFYRLRPPHRGGGAPPAPPRPPPGLHPLQTIAPPGAPPPALS